MQGNRIVILIRSLSSQVYNLVELTIIPTSGRCYMYIKNTNWNNLYLYFVVDNFFFDCMLGSLPIDREDILYSYFVSLGALCDFGIFSSSICRCFSVSVVLDISSLLSAVQYFLITACLLPSVTHTLSTSKYHINDMQCRQHYLYKISAQARLAQE